MPTSKSGRGGVKGLALHTHTHTHCGNDQYQTKFCSGPTLQCRDRHFLIARCVLLKRNENDAPKTLQIFVLKSTPPNPVLRLFICIITTAVNGNPGPPLSPGQICSSGVHKDLTTTKIQSTGFPSCLHFLLGT